MPDHVHFILWLRPSAENCPTLGRIVCAYKSLIGRAALSHLRTLGDICGDHFWQRDYYDHIISNKAELQEIRKYIRDNPYKQENGEASMPYEGRANTRPKIETYRSPQL
jgi:putative transposase